MPTMDAWVSNGPGQKLARQQFELGPLGSEEVEVEVEHCGLCHSDLSMSNNDWGVSQYPAVFGHEVTGRIVAVGESAKGVHVGQQVGIGWNAGSCMHCRPCLSGDHHLCAQSQPTIVGRHGGFATRVRSHWAWAIPIPHGLPVAEAGPLLCGGITVFAPLAMYAKPTDRVGIVGIGGLGHMAVKFAVAYGCEVTAFTSSATKFDEVRQFGAHHTVATRDPDSIQKIAGTLDLLIVTTNVQLDWQAMISTLAPNGRMHIVGVVLDPIPISIFPVIMKQANISASPTGSPVMTATMLEFAALHQITPTTEHYPMSQINAAFERLHEGKARYRIVLDADF